MRNRRSYHLVGLWQVWDLLPDAPDARERPPEALEERFVRTFDGEPDRKAVSCALAQEKNLLREEYEASERLSYRVINEETRKSLLQESGWNLQFIRRHTIGGERLRALSAYGFQIDRLVDINSTLWAPAKDYGPPFEAVMETLDQMGKEQGLEPEDPEFEIPYFRSKRRPIRERRTHRRCDRDL